MKKGDWLLFAKPLSSARPHVAKRCLSPFFTVPVPLLIAALALTACPDKASQPPGDDRLLAKLKAEKDREAKEGPIVPPTKVEPPPQDEKVNPLAEFAAKGTQRRELALPSKTLVQSGKASLRLTALEATHTVGGAISITTDDWFLVATFTATGPEGSEVDLTSAYVEKGEKQFGHARDAQAASRKAARVAITKDGSTVTAYYEVPKDALGPGLVLVVPDGANSAKLELQ